MEIIAKRYARFLKMSTAQLYVQSFPRFPVIKMFHLAQSNPNPLIIVFKNSIEDGRNRTYPKPAVESWLELRTTYYTLIIVLREKNHIATYNAALFRTH